MILAEGCFVDISTCVYFNRKGYTALTGDNWKGIKKGHMTIGCCIGDQFGFFTGLECNKGNVTNLVPVRGCASLGRMVW